MPDLAEKEVVRIRGLSDTDQPVSGLASGNLRFAWNLCKEYGGHEPQAIVEGYYLKNRLIQPLRTFAIKLNLHRRQKRYGLDQPA